MKLSNHSCTKVLSHLFSGYLIRVRKIKLDSFNSECSNFMNSTCFNFVYLCMIHWDGIGTVHNGMPDHLERSNKEKKEAKDVCFSLFFLCVPCLRDDWVSINWRDVACVTDTLHHVISFDNPTGDVQPTPCYDEYSCLAARLSEAERLNLEAIRTLHSKLDDDANGNIDLSESDEVSEQQYLLKAITMR